MQHPSPCSWRKSSLKLHPALQQRQYITQPQPPGTCTSWSSQTYGSRAMQIACRCATLLQPSRLNSGLFWQAEGLCTDGHILCPATHYCWVTEPPLSSEHDTLQLASLG